MFLSKELLLINHSLKTTPEMGKGRLPSGEMVDVPKGREFRDLKELKLAISINDKLSSCIENDMFKDGEMEFSTEEKSFLLKLIDRPWGLNEGKEYISLIDKLS